MRRRDQIAGVAVLAAAVMLSAGWRAVAGAKAASVLISN